MVVSIYTIEYLNSERVMYSGWAIKHWDGLIFCPTITDKNTPRQDTLGCIFGMDNSELANKAKKLQQEQNGKAWQEHDAC